MAASVADIARLRRMVAEPGVSTYTDLDVAGYIERYPMLDGLGQDPWALSATSPPTRTVNTSWTPTYDMAAAAAEIWGEKAAALAAKFDFTTDNDSFSLSQKYKHALEMERKFKAQRQIRSIQLRPEPWLGPVPTLSINYVSEDY